MSADADARQDLIKQAATYRPPISAEVVDKYVDALTDDGPYFAMNRCISETMEAGILAGIEANGFMPGDPQQREALNKFVFIQAATYLGLYIEEGIADELIEILPLEAYAIGVDLGSTFTEEELQEFLADQSELPLPERVQQESVAAAA